MSTKPRFLDLNSVQDRYELTSAYLRREGDTVLGALRIQGGKITTADRGARVEQDIYGLRGYNAAEAIVFEFDTATGSLTLVGTISAGSTITGSEFRTAESPNKRITIGESPDDRINFYSGFADETAAGFVRVQALGTAGTQRFELDLFSGQISSQDAASVVLLSETKDGATETVITLSADTILGLATSTSVDTTLQLLGDIALQDAFSDPPVAASGFVRVWNSGGQSLRSISSSVTAPLAPHRQHTGVPTSALTATTTLTDIPGMTTSFTTYSPNATYNAVATARFNPNAVAISETLILWLLVDGGIVTASLFTNLTTLNYNWPLTVNWTGTLASPGTHTIKCQASRSPGGAGTVLVGGSDSGYGALSVSTVG
ncbi:MAG: hypothetical protein WAT66_14645 [Actinomycetota bacterium]